MSLPVHNLAKYYLEENNKYERDPKYQNDDDLKTIKTCKQKIIEYLNNPENRGRQNEHS